MWTKWLLFFCANYFTCQIDSIFTKSSQPEASKVDSRNVSAETFLFKAHCNDEQALYSRTVSY